MNALGYLDIVKELIEHGVDLDAKDTENEWTAAHWAAYRSKYIFQIHSKWIEFILHWFPILDYRPIVQMLVDSGANVDLEDKNGRTAAVVAEQRGSIPFPGYFETNIELFV